jgi:hypothetical protein
LTTHATTHDLTFDGDRVIKRFVSWDRGEHLREWRGLSLLARYAPDLAPQPLSAQLDQDPPTIAMSRLPGESLGGTPLTDAQIDALAAALIRMQASVPEDQLVGAEANFSPLKKSAVLLEMVQKSAMSSPDKHNLDAFDDTVRQASAAATRFATSAWATNVAKIGGTPRQVFGQVDGNLANFLWDGTVVRLVDFEDSGSSDPTFELANLLEHITVIHQAGLDPERVIARFTLTPAERARLRIFRRGFAVYWLLRLLPGGPSYQRNPPGTLEAQAAHLLSL